MISSPVALVRAATAASLLVAACFPTPDRSDVQLSSEGGATNGSETGSQSSRGGASAQVGSSNQGGASSQSADDDDDDDDDSASGGASGGNGGSMATAGVGGSPEGGSNGQGGTEAGGNAGTSSDAGGSSGSGGASATAGGNPGSGGASDATGGNLGAGGDDTALGGSSSEGGTAGSSTPIGCTINSIYYSSGSMLNGNACTICDPSFSTSTWRQLDPGAECEDGSVCNSSQACVVGCWIEDTYRADGTANPENPCYSCDVTKSTQAWSETPTSTCVTAVATGYSSTCAIVGGAVRCWGDNRYGNLGNSSTSDSYSPIQVEGLSSGVTAISGNASHTCAVTDGGAKCWGSNYYGAIGNNATSEAVLLPTQVSGLTAGVTAISGGTYHTCAVANGAVTCWGDNRYGQLGIGTNAVSASLVPVQVPGLAANITALSPGAAKHACAIVGSAALCWGIGWTGRLGNNDTTEATAFSPVQVEGLTAGVQEIAVGDRYTCAVVDGRAQCWGYGGEGQLGNNSTAVAYVPSQVQGLTTGVTGIFTGGGSHSCALLGEDAYCWGYNANGQLGSGSNTNSYTPVQVQGLSAGITTMAVGGDHTCAIVSGSLYCWGHNSYGQLGNGSNTDSQLPVKVEFE